ncbi:MAG: hypothetical protein B7Z12_18650 [Caulobacter vibrioides]|uniref:Uncharacterized protein n=1 Tax=Caulobacter vibrioides TaxID=155892 RepID=A0A258CUL1_CAUVI|nr:MAG: hypothetical protein B7Z12_18650 [Caulobacter vibrioides]
MESDSKPEAARGLDRINLRVSGVRFAQIDDAHAARLENLSRNTCIAGAVEEKLAREPVQARAKGGGFAHG